MENKCQYFSDASSENSTIQKPLVTFCSLSTPPEAWLGYRETGTCGRPKMLIADIQQDRVVLDQEVLNDQIAILPL